MKKKLLVVLLVLIVFTSGVLVEKLLFSNNEVDDGLNDVSQAKHEHMLSMMLETDSGSGEYTLETRSSWPTKEDGYVFNSSLSKCEKGSKLSWDDENNLVLMEGTTSDKCYVYFDVYVEQAYHESCNDNTLACYVAKQYTEIQGNNNLYYHNSTLENGAKDNSYRYAGSSDTTNNFVCFGSDAATCPDDNLYRIIGVFGDQVRIIKWDYSTTALLGTDGDSNGACSANSNCVSGINDNYYKGSNTAANIGAYWWNNDGTTYGTNTWSASELNTVNLNKNFLTNIGTAWANKIASTTWKVGGNTEANIKTSAMNVAYQNEIVSPADSKTYNAKIGLMYVSDYGYAASPTYWTYPGYGYSGASYDYRAAIGENWMYMGLNEWTVMRCSGDSRFAFLVHYSGLVDNYYLGFSNSAFGARPVFYLNSDVTYVSGDGSKNLPIRIN